MVCQVFSFEDGVREERATENFLASIVAVYEYQGEEGLDDVVTKTAVVEIPVPWRFILESGRAYDLSATKAQYRYDAALAQVIPQWNAEALQEYIDTHPDPTALDYDEDDAVRWIDGVPGTVTEDVTGADHKTGVYLFEYDAHRDVSLEVVFEAIPAYTVTAVKVGGGAGSSVAPTGAVLSAPGESATFTWAADTAYLVESVSIRKADGTELETLGEADLAAGSYTFRYDELDGDRTMVVTFKKDDNPGGLTPLAYSISTGKTGSGVISDSKALTVSGDTYTVTW